MPNIEKDKQGLVVERINQEMAMAEMNLMNWHTTWIEHLDEARISVDQITRYRYDHNNTDSELMRIYQQGTFNRNNMLPIKTVNVSGDYLCDVYTISWNNILTNNTSRRITFKNNGDISLKKEPIKVKKNGSKNIDYIALFNVLYEDFEIVLRHATYSNDEKCEVDNIIVSANDKAVVRRYNGVEIVNDLVNKTKKFIINRTYFTNGDINASLEFNMDESNNLVNASLELKSANYSKNKFEGVYNLNIENGTISAWFTSNNGIRINLIKNPMLLRTMNSLCLPAGTSSSNKLTVDSIISHYIHFTENVIACHDFNEFEFDSKYYDMSTLLEIEKIINDSIKEIKGEIPLEGLESRISTCLKNVSVKKDTTKTIK